MSELTVSYSIKSPNKRRIVKVGSAVTAGILALTGCSDSSSKHPATLTFNDLDKTADALIGVYKDYLDRGAGSSPADSFAPGVVVDALCVATGRQVSSHPERHEENRSSNLWVGITGHDGTRDFATVTYADIDVSTLHTLPKC